MLERLHSKSRLDTPDGSHDSSDVQDVVLRQLTDATATTSDVIPSDSVAAQAERAATVSSPEVPPQSADTPATGSAKFEPSGPPVAPVATTTTTALSLLPALVPYFSDDDASCDDAALTTIASTDNHSESHVQPVSVAPSSPETFPVKEVRISSDVAPITVVGSGGSAVAGEEGKVTVPSVPLTLPVEPVGRLIHGSPDDRTSPVIVDDPMFDAAFTWCTAIGAVICFCFIIKNQH